jgi:hypothetical protein
MVTPIEDYAVLGDTETAALVSRAGSIDWLCLPHFDSHACFAALLGTPENGRWLIGPVAPARTTRRYLDHSFVLETIHETADGAVRVTDLMPLGDGRADLIRRVQGVRGTVRMRHEWVVRFNYGRIRPWVSRSPGHEQDSGVITAVAGPDMLGSPDKVLSVNSEETEETLRLLDTLEDPNSPIRAVVSVDMLKEGWDVKNIYVIASTKALESTLLTEQILGRGLRLPFGQRTGNPMLDTVEVLSHNSFASLLKRAKALLEETLGDRVEQATVVVNPQPVALSDWGNGTSNRAHFMVDFRESSATQGVTK